MRQETNRHARGQSLQFALAAFTVFGVGRPIRPTETRAALLAATPAIFAVPARTVPTLRPASALTVARTIAFAMTRPRTSSFRPPPSGAAVVATAARPLIVISAFVVLVRLGVGRFFDPGG